MHRNFVACMLLFVLFGVTACGQQDTEPVNTGDSITTQQQQDILDNETERTLDTDNVNNEAEQSSETGNVNNGVEQTPKTGSADNHEDGMGVDTMQIQVTDQNGNTVLIQLNDSSAAKSLYEQLPLTISVENYSSNEKIFYPPEKLDTADAPMAEGGAGVLAYFAPWGDVVMYYGDFDKYPGLYELGNTTSGVENIEGLTGELQISKVE